MGLIDEQHNDIAQQLHNLGLQIAQLASELSGATQQLNSTQESNNSAFKFGAQDKADWMVEDRTTLTPHKRIGKPALPDPRYLRRIIQHRQLRTRHFPADLFADPAWDIILDLAIARIEQKRVSITSACIASGVPPTTALRWITHMTNLGLLKRTEDDLDKRRAFVALSDKAAEALARYFFDIRGK